MGDPSSGVAPRRRRRVAEAAPAIRLAHLVRSPSPEPGRAALEGGIVVELNEARVTVGRGADVSMVVTVLAMLRGADR